jgi:multimeric flavodoxin WrbA
VTAALAAEGVETETLSLARETFRGCIGCMLCFENKNRRCAVESDNFNDILSKMIMADGILLGSPVHYAGMGGTMKSFLDRTFYVCGANGGLLRHKVGASVVAVRRSGGLPAFNQLNNFLLYAEMMIPTSNYWNVIHGTAPGEATQDPEGMQIMQVLGSNMAYLLKLVEHGKGSVVPPQPQAKTYTHFVR